MSEMMFPRRREQLGVAAAKEYTERNLEIIAAPNGFPIKETHHRGIVVWSSGASPELVSIPMDERDLVTERNLLHALVTWGEATGTHIALFIPNEAESYVKDLLSIWSISTGQQNRFTRIKPVSLPRFQLPELLDLARALIHESVLSQLVVFGSAAMQLHGLPREANDLDLFVADELFDGWTEKLFLKVQKKAGVEMLRPSLTSKIEIFKTFPGVSFEQVRSEAISIAAAAPMRVGSMHHLLQWKRVQNSTKDQEDIPLLQEALSKISGLP